MNDGSRFIEVIDRLYEGKEVFFHYIRTVSDVMTTDVKGLTLDHKISDALQFFKTFGVRHIPIIEEESTEASTPGGRQKQPGKRILVGIISERDILRVLSFGFGTMLETEEDPKVLKQPLLSVVRRKLRTATPDLSIFDTVRMMVDDKIDCIPVITGPDHERELVGIFTSHDVTRCFLRMEVLRKAREIRPRSARLIDFVRGADANQPTDLLFESLLGRVADVMQENVITLNVDDPFRRAIELVQEHRIRHLPVLDSSGRLKGILSDRDILRFLPPPDARFAERGKGTRLATKFRDDLFRIADNDEVARKALAEKVSVAMAVNPVVVEPMTSMVKVAEVFCGRKISAVPVVIPNDKGITGIVTRTDFLSAILALGRLLSGSNPSMIRGG